MSPQHKKAIAIRRFDFEFEPADIVKEYQKIGYEYSEQEIKEVIEEMEKKEIKMGVNYERLRVARKNREHRIT
jgi:hypothetical protein